MQHAHTARQRRRHRRQSARGPLKAAGSPRQTRSRAHRPQATLPQPRPTATCAPASWACLGRRDAYPRLARPVLVPERGARRATGLLAGAARGSVRRACPQAAAHASRCSSEHAPSRQPTAAPLLRASATHTSSAGARDTARQPRQRYGQRRYQAPDHQLGGLPLGAGELRAAASRLAARLGLPVPRRRALAWRLC